MKENHRLEEALKAGVKIPENGYWGDMPSKICGAFGGATNGDMEKGAVESSENKIKLNENE